MRKRNKSEDEKQNQIYSLNKLIDEITEKLHQKVDDLNVKAKTIIQNKASNIWEKSPIQDVEEDALCNVREPLDYEIRRYEMDELSMAERSKEVEVLYNQFEAFLHSQIQLPPDSAYALEKLSTQLQTSISQLESEMSRLNDTFIRKLNSRAIFNNWDSVQIE